MEHPSFPQPSNLGARVWRYLDFSKFYWLVREHRLFMPAAHLLGDNFEGCTPAAELKWWDEQAEQAKAESDKAIIRANRRTLSEFARTFQQQYYVSCWTMSEYEDVAMWERYAGKSGEAVAIYTDYRSLRRALPPNTLLGIVRYIDYDVERLPTMNLFDHIMHKRVEFAVEREVRAVACPVYQQSNETAGVSAAWFSKEDDQSFQVFAPLIDLGLIVQGIVLHPAANQKFADSVAALTATNKLPSPVCSRLSAQPTF